MTVKSILKSELRSDELTTMESYWGTVQKSIKLLQRPENSLQSHMHQSVTLLTFDVASVITEIYVCLSLKWRKTIIM